MTAVTATQGQWCINKWWKEILKVTILQQRNSTVKTTFVSITHYMFGYYRTPTYPDLSLLGFAHLYTTGRKLEVVSRHLVYQVENSY